MKAAGPKRARVANARQVKGYISRAFATRAQQLAKRNKTDNVRKI